jgi:hypothetical protein
MTGKGQIQPIAGACTNSRIGAHSRHLKKVDQNAHTGH